MNIEYVRPMEVKVDPDPLVCLITIRSGGSSTRGRRTTWGTYLLDDHIELGPEASIVAGGQ